MEVQRALRLIESNDVGGEHSDKDFFIFHSPFFSEGPWHVIVKGTNFIWSVSRRKVGFLIVILWEEEVWCEPGCNHCNKKGKVVEGFGAIVGLSNPLITIINILYFAKSRGWEVLRKESVVQMSMKVCERSIFDKPF